MKFDEEAGRSMLKKLTVFIILQCVLAGPGLAQGFPSKPQGFPSKPMRILVPGPAGSSPDIRARQIAGKLSEALGQPVLVENRPGGAGLIAAREAAKAAPDGHTLLLALINNAIADVLKPDPCCRLNQELLPVSRFTMTPLVVVVHPSLQVSSLVDFIQIVKQKRGSVTYASHGPGSISQLVGEWIRSETGTDMVEVPYKAVNAELTDLAGGQVMTAFPVPQVVAGAVKSGKLRALAVLGPSRINVLPDVPTVKEAGLPGIEALAWNGIFVPAGTPQPVIERLHRELVRAYNAPDVKGQVTATGSTVAADTPQEFAAFIRAEKEKWGKVIREAKVKPD
jgi:tripartite-type tricarboxylate transporter receptor subunit TctC